MLHDSHYLFDASAHMKADLGQVREEENSSRKDGADVGPLHPKHFRICARPTWPLVGPMCNEAAFSGNDRLHLICAHNVS